MEMGVTFPGGKRVDATFNGFTVATDQPRQEGGDGSAPQPYDLFLASLGTCAGIYVLSFCKERGIDISDLKMILRAGKNPRTHLLETVGITLDLPLDFPEKYRNAVVRAAELCTVKRTLAAPPQITVTARTQE